MKQIIGTKIKTNGSTGDRQHTNGGEDDGDTPFTEQADKPRFQLKGASVLDFAQRPIDTSQTLLGDRYLCRGNGMFIFAPSGVGKSVLTIQAASLWACGKEAFGMKPNGMLRSLIIQSEDDDGDVTEMSRMINSHLLGLSSADRKLVGANTHVEFVNDSWGPEFLERLEDYIKEFKPDIIWINPYSAFVGGKGIMDEESNTSFLRHGLNALLKKYNLAVILVHHTPKTNNRNTEAWDVVAYSYSGAGWAVLTNWPRAVLVIDPMNQNKNRGVYKFVAAKRGDKIGWHGLMVRYWSHSKTTDLVWIQSTPEEVEKAKTQNDPESLLQLISVGTPISQEDLKKAAKGIGIGDNKAEKFWKVLLAGGKIWKWKIPRKGARAEIGYAQSPPDAPAGGF